jgi:4-hydroxy-3-polyprenylbenzoate decarboxylase
MLKLARLGVRILPAMPGFYHHPKTIDDLVEHFIYRLLDHLGVSHEQLTRWEGSKKRGSGE